MSSVKKDTADALDNDYAAAGFGGHLAFGKKPALILVDVVEAYLQPHSSLYAPGFVQALESCIRLTAAARKLGVPVIFTNVVYHAGGLDGGLFYHKVPALKVYLEGSPLAEFSPRLLPLPNEVVVTKQYPSAFFGTSLASTLRTMGIDTVILTGFSTSGCVRASTLDALQNGFIPYVAKEACGERDQRPQESNLFDLQAKYAEVVSESEVIDLMTKAVAV